MYQCRVVVVDFKELEEVLEMCGKAGWTLVPPIRHVYDQSLVRLIFEKAEGS